MVWSGVVWCGVVWCGVVCGAVRCGAVRCVMVVWWVLGSSRSTQVSKPRSLPLAGERRAPFTGTAHFSQHVTSVTLGNGQHGCRFHSGIACRQDSQLALNCCLGLELGARPVDVLESCVLRRTH